MHVFVARQPIFDTSHRVVGYELLHRSGLTNAYSGVDGTVATGQLLSDSVMSDEWSVLTSGRPAWVNFPASLLLDGSATLVPADRMVVEVLEDVDADDEIMAACRKLRASGYRVAADDVIDPDDDNPLLSIADIVKVDFRQTTTVERLRLARRFRGKVQLLAEKVETQADRRLAEDLGYQLLQGYFLREPVTVRQNAIDRTRLGVIGVIAAVMKEPIDFEELENALKREVALTDKLLRYLNSAQLAWRQHTTSLRSAMVALGELNLRRWVSLAALTAVSTEQPDDLLTSTLVRARMCERLAPLLSPPAQSLDLFLVGLYSQLHLLIGTDLATALEQAPVPPAIRKALETDAGPLADALRLVSNWERADWQVVNDLARNLGVPGARLPELYADALTFAHDLRTNGMAA